MTSTSTSTTELQVRQDGHTLWVTFNRPERLNAATESMEDAIIAACRFADDNDDIRVVVFEGRDGSRPSFMAGADIAGMTTLESAEDVRKLEAHAERTLAAIEGLRVPAIAALDGPVIGQGALLASCCDISLAGPSVRFGFPIAKTVGNCLSTKNLTRLVELVGVPLTRTMIMRAKLLNTDELARAGAVSEKAETHEGLRELTREIAREVAGLAPLTLSYTKASLLRMRGPASDNEELVVKSYLSEDSREAVTAFLEKRPPHWLGH